MRAKRSTNTLLLQNINENRPGAVGENQILQTPFRLPHVQKRRLISALRQRSQRAQRRGTPRADRLVENRHKLIGQKIMLLASLVLNNQRGRGTKLAVVALTVTAKERLDMIAPSHAQL